jgi:hypothetical protein
MAPAQLFISYRRDDSAGYARALHEALAQAYSPERVFIDVDDIAAGQRFADVIHQALGASAVLLVLIGPRWAGPRAGAPARVHDADDFVRLELEAGLAQGLHLVPVLLDGTPLPAADDLPPSLRPLLHRQALALRSQGFQADVAQLLAALQARMGPPARAAVPLLPSLPQSMPQSSPNSPPIPPREHASPPRRTVTLGAASLLLAAVAGAGLWWTQRAQGLRPEDWAGDWGAEVTYPWPNAVYGERISLRVEGDTLSGSASFLRVPRVISEVQLHADSLRFTTRTVSEDSVQRWEDLHRYQLQRLSDGQLQVQMQTESQGVVGQPLRFTASLAAPPS